MSLDYNPGIPQPSDRLSDSQSDLLTNFTDIPTFMAVNHEPFTSSNYGKHKFLTLTDQTATGGLTTLVNEVGLFTKNDVFGNLQLFYRSSGQASGTPATQLTPIPSIFAWGAFNGSTGALIGPSYNVTGPITINGDGSYTITYTNAIVSGTVYPWFTSGSTTATGGFPNVITNLAASIRIAFLFGNTAAAATPSFVSFIIWLA